jgi:enamine deaminase RidA (YjgF/YER057c/UK114 family)
VINHYTGDALAQARQVFANITAVRTARDEFVVGGPPPASSLVQVAGLVLPGALLEIDALAVLP